MSETPVFDAPVSETPVSDAPVSDAPVVAPVAAPSADDNLILRLQGFEGPMDLLLDLARSQKVDLAAISILQLVEQYLAIVEGARRIRLELAADWLVMAAWLTWLKSRLLLPPDAAEAEDAELAADQLAARLRELQTMRAAAAWLGARPQLGLDLFPRGAAETLIAHDRSRLLADVSGLLRAYLAARRRAGASTTYRPKPMPLWSVQSALERIGRLLGSLPDWTSLEQFLPEDGLAAPLQRRGAVAATLLAGLEMARDGRLTLRQDSAFGPIMLGPGGTEPARETR
jgi:segregation and condensation protein A